MAKSYQRTLLVGLLTLAPLFGACERASDISGLTESPTATIAAKHKKEAQVLKSASNQDAGKTVSETVTPGKPEELRIGKFKLWIPKGAVKNPTTFRMTVVSGPVIGVSLQAFDNQGEPITQFLVPLKLTLPYEGLGYDVENPSDFRLANIVSESDQTILEVVNVNVDQKEKTITGNITHFSVWSLAIQVAKELSPGID